MKITGAGLLWSAIKGQLVADFRNGPIETNDPHIIDLARLSGFEIEVTETQPVALEPSAVPADKPRRGRPAKAL